MGNHAVARPSRAIWAVLALMAVGTALRLTMLGQSVFADELATYWIVSTRSLSGVFSIVHTNAEITPPLSFALAWLSTRVDLTPEMLRLPSLAAGVAIIPGVYLLGVRTVGRSAGLVAAALTALAPFMAFYATEGRGYAVMMALLLASTLAMLTAVDDGRRRWWVLYGLATCLTMYTHYTAAFVLVTQLAWVLITHPRARVPALVATAAAAAAYLPWLTGLGNDLSSPTTDILSALQPFDPYNVGLTALHWSVGYPYATVGMAEVPGVAGLAMLAAALVVAAVGTLARARAAPPSPSAASDDHRLALVVALALATPVAAFAISLVGTNLFSTRNLAASWPALAVAVSALLVAPRRPLRLVAVTLAVGGLAIAAGKLAFDDATRRPDYEQAARYVNRTAEPDDVVIDETGVLSPGPLSHIDPYVDQPRTLIRSLKPQQRERPFSVFDTDVPPDVAARRAGSVAGGGRIYVVTGARRAGVARPLGRYRLAATKRYRGLIDLVVQVYEDPASRPR